MPIVDPGQNGSGETDEAPRKVAAAEGVELGTPLTEWRAAADPTVPLTERLERYEDLIDSEIGDTTLARARNVERESGLRQIWLKFDGGNPTGTQKDRIAFAQAKDAMRRGFDTMTVATCGNYGAALAVAASLAGLGCRIFVPRDYHTRRTNEMESFGATIERVDGDYETAVARSRSEAERAELYDANPGGANDVLQLDAYAEIASEIYDELRDAPAIVALPVSNGTTLAGVYKGFARLYRRGRTSRIPKMVAGSSSGKNPIVHSWIKQLDRCEDLDPGKIRETAVNEPLINWHAFDGQAALDAIRDSEAWAGYASDRTMLRQTKLLREQEGLSVLPASTAGLAVLLARHAESPLPSDRYVVILTGRR